MEYIYVMKDEYSLGKKQNTAKNIQVSVCLFLYLSHFLYQVTMIQHFVFVISFFP